MNKEVENKIWKAWEYEKHNRGYWIIITILGRQYYI